MQAMIGSFPDSLSKIMGADSFSDGIAKSRSTTPVGIHGPRPPEQRLTEEDHGDSHMNTMAKPNGQLSWISMEQLRNEVRSEQTLLRDGELWRWRIYEVNQTLDTDESAATPTGGDPVGPHCAICKKTPDAISIYVQYAEENGMSPDDYVLLNEGTFNYRNNLFYCDQCYVLIGMPMGKAVPV